MTGNYMQKFAEMYVGRVSLLRQFVGHVDTSTREIIGRLFGIVTSELSISNVVTLLEDLTTTFNPAQKTRYSSKCEVNGILKCKLSERVRFTMVSPLLSDSICVRFEEAQGAVCATGYILAQCMTGMPTVSMDVTLI